MPTDKKKTDDLVDVSIVECKQFILIRIVNELSNFNLTKKAAQSKIKSIVFKNISASIKTKVTKSTYYIESSAQEQKELLANAVQKAKDAAVKLSRKLIADILENDKSIQENINTLARNNRIPIASSTAPIPRTRPANARRLSEPSPPPRTTDTFEDAMAGLPRATSHDPARVNDVSSIDSASSGSPLILNGYSIEQTRSDGNCFYDAVLKSCSKEDLIAASLFLTAEDYEKGWAEKLISGNHADDDARIEILREMVARYIEDHQGLYFDQIDWQEDRRFQTLEDFVDAVRNGKWGTEIEADALSKILSRPILAFDEDYNPINLPDENLRDKEPIYVLNIKTPEKANQDENENRNVHFVALVKPRHANEMTKPHASRQLAANQPHLNMNGMDAAFGAVAETGTAPSDNSSNHRPLLPSNNSRHNLDTAANDNEGRNAAIPEINHHTISTIAMDINALKTQLNVACAKFRGKYIADTTKLPIVVKNNNNEEISTISIHPINKETTKI